MAGKQAIDEIAYFDINGVRQCVGLRADRPGLPLLLYLHGGPGDAALPLVRKYGRNLEEHFTVAVWEQRGAGKSYYPFGADEMVTIDVFVEDAIALAEILLARFSQQKLYLVGHSWGSVLGLKVIKKRPDLVHTYVGCGQVVNMEKSCRHAWEFALEANRKAGNSETAARIEHIDPLYSGENWLEDLLFVTGQVVKHGGSLYGKSSYNRMIKDFILAPNYSLKELLNRQRGALQSIERLWPELMGVDFEGVTHFDVPVVFVEGRHDRHVWGALVFEYSKKIESPVEFVWFERACHFPQWSEAEKFASVMKEIL